MRPVAFPSSSYWLFAVIVIQLLCQLGMLSEFLSPIRIVFRSGSYVINIAALLIAFGPRRQPHHPAFWLGWFILIWVALQFLNPTTNTALSALASWVFTASILAPLFWVPRLQITPQVIRGVIICLWGFHSLSSVFGVLQVYYPGQFQPAVSQAVLNNMFQGKNVEIQIAGGETIFRPMGLTDIPGGSASAGLYAFVFGLGLFSLSRGFGWTTISLLSLPVGLFCIYVSQVRVMLVLGVIISLVYASLLAVTRRFGSAVRTSFIVPVVMAGAFVWAVALGGEATTARFELLISENPDEVYAKSRGNFLEETLNEHIFDYPFGAGLGRWGQVNTYFGDPTIEDSYSLWAEIQWTAWVYDGGVLLVVAYLSAMFVAMWGTAKVAFSPDMPDISGWAMLILAYDVAMLALTFSFVPFNGPQGVEFWMLNAMIWTAGRHYPRRAVWHAG